MYENDLKRTLDGCDSFLDAVAKLRKSDSSGPITAAAEWERVAHPPKKPAFLQDIIQLLQESTPEMVDPVQQTKKKMNPKKAKRVAKKAKAKSQKASFKRSPSKVKAPPQVDDEDDPMADIAELAAAAGIGDAYSARAVVSEHQIFIYLHAHAHTDTHAHTQAHAHTHMHLHMHTHMPVRIHAYMRAHTCMRNANAHEHAQTLAQSRITISIPTHSSNPSAHVQRACKPARTQSSHKHSPMCASGHRRRGRQR